MSSSPLFQSATRKRIETAILETLNNEPEIVSASSLSSPRAVGDAVQEILGERLKGILGSDCKDYSDAFARRAMADIAFYDASGSYHVVDVKTHNTGTQFNMPNLTSVERLARFYEDDKNFFTLLIVAYEVAETKPIFDKCYFVPIERLSWECLAIGALGWGQIQIANANVIKIDDSASRKLWMLELFDTMARFYPKEIEKIDKRLSYFERVKQRWETK